VTRVAVDPTDATVSYVTISGFRWDEPLPHVFRSTDFGANWTDVSANLPQAPVNDIVIDPQAPSRLWVATDFGVYASADGGAVWSAAGTGLPNVVVTDLELHDPTRTLVVATYGRSMWTLDVPLATGAEAVTASAVAATLAPVVPNPAPGGQATIRFSLPRAAEVSLRVYDVAGRLVRVLEEAQRPAGERTLAWDGRDAAGEVAAPGVYLVRLVADGVSRTRRVTVLR
jgi:hypothetical protein